MALSAEKEMELQQLLEQERLQAIEKSKVIFESSNTPSNNEPMSEDEFNSIPVENLPDITLPSQVDTNMN